MNDLTMHYAASTGSLKVAVSHVAMMLRLALKTQRTEAGLRRELVELLGYVERENADQQARDRRAGTAIGQRGQCGSAALRDSVDSEIMISAGGAT